MNKPPKLLVLDAGLFPDASTLEVALQHLPEKGVVQRREISPAEMDDAAWDKLLGDILAAQTIVTL